MLLGRDQEQQTLRRLLEAARAGESGALAIAGEAGIGKSALLAYAEEQAADMNVLRARGVQSEAYIPFASLFELLRPALALVNQIPGRRPRRWRARWRCGRPAHPAVSRWVRLPSVCWPPIQSNPRWPF